MSYLWDLCIHTNFYPAARYLCPERISLEIKFLLMLPNVSVKTFWIQFRVVLYDESENNFGNPYNSFYKFV